MNLSTLPLAAPTINGADTAWLLISTVLVLLMTIPGIILFYSGMVRAKNALSIAAHTIVATAVVTLVWTAIGYSLAFTTGNEWLGGLGRAMGHGLVGPKAGVHELANTIPESIFFLFQLAFAIITFALVLGATAERMRIGATIVFAALWVIGVYAPVAHWIWQPSGWLALKGHMDFAGGTVVHVVCGTSGLVAAWVTGPRKGFGKEPMVPHNLMLTVIGTGLLWIGWFGFNAGSAMAAGTRAGGALLATQVAACAGAMVWALCEMLQRSKASVLGLASGAIAGLVAVTPASGFVDVSGALAMGAAAGLVCFLAATKFKAMTGIDDSLDVFALHGVGGLLGTMLTPVLANSAIAPVTSSILTNTVGALAVMAYTAVVTWIILKIVSLGVGLRVSEKEESLGLDLAQHGEMLSSK